MWTGALLAAAGLILLALRAKRIRRVEQARTLARALIPEITALLASCEAQGGAPLAGHRTGRERISPVLSKEAAYAVQAFYQSVDEYAEASRETLAAFARKHPQPR